MRPGVRFTPGPELARTGPRTDFCRFPRQETASSRLGTGFIQIRHYAGRKGNRVGSLARKLEYRPHRLAVVLTSLDFKLILPQNRARFLARWAQCHVRSWRVGLTVMRTAAAGGVARPSCRKMAAVGHTPQRRRAKLPASCGALLEPIGETRAHVVEKKVRVEERWRRIAVRGKRRRMARRTADGREHGAAGRRSACGG